MIFDNVMYSLKDKMKINPGEMTNVSVGKVESFEPLKIKLDNNITLTDDFATLSDLCKEYIIEDEEIILENVQITLPSISFSSHGESHTIPSQTITAPKVQGTVKKLRLWKNLEEGEQVNMIKSYGGQSYFVVDRERL